MNEFQFVLLVGAIITALLSRRLPRSHLWIAAGASSFVVSTAWWRYDMPYPPAFTLGLDAAVCLLIYFFGRERWEERIYQIFQLSVLVSLVYLAGPIEIGTFTIHMSHWLYVVMLEICNWLALAVIGGTAILDGIKEHESGAGYARGHRVRHARASWREVRSSPPFHKVSK